MTIYAIFHAYYDPEPGFLGIQAYWGADDGSDYPELPDEYSLFEAAASNDCAQKRAMAACQDWVSELALAVSALNGRLARGEIDLPAEAASA